MSSGKNRPGVIRILKRSALSALSVVALLVAITVIWILSRYEPFPDAVPVDVAQIPGSTLSMQHQVALTDTLARYREDFGLPSVSAAVGLNGDLVYAAAIGYSDLERRTPVTIDSIYRIGSVSKSITGVVLGALMDDGSVNIDTDFRVYVPNFPRKRWAFSMRQLASHTAGIRDYKDGFFGTLNELSHNRTHYETVSSALVLIEDDPLIYQPGTDYEYSSYGINILSAGLEQAGHLSFDELLHEHVFEPASMHTARVEDVRNPDPLSVSYYIQVEGMSLRAPLTDNSYKIASGGLVASPQELVEFGNQLLDGTLVSPATRESLFTPVSRDRNGDGYGLGFEIESLEIGELSISEIGHGGGSIGGRTSFWMYPDYRLVVVVTTNANPYIDIGMVGDSWRRPKRIGQEIATRIIESLSPSPPAD